MPHPDGGVYSQSYALVVPASLRPGRYKLKFKLYSNQEQRDVFVALDPTRLDEQNYYLLAPVNINK